MRIIGITGGVASGKSTVARKLKQLGAVVLDADELGHVVLRLPQIKAAARQRWGEKVFGADGQIDRASLARIVFAPGPEGEGERRYLEQLTHPKIARFVRLQADVLGRAGAKVVVLDAPLLMEASWDDLCERTVFVDAPWETRVSRALERGWTKEDFAAREAAQESLQHKRERADAIIDNSGSPQRTQAQVEHFWASLIR